MRITLIKYISKEIWSIFLTCLIVFIFIIMASKMLDMTELMVNYGAGPGDLSSMMLCLIPRFILFAMPVACLTAVLLSFIRMSSDNEIIALHSSGISLYQLMPSVAIFSLICFLFTGFLTLYLVPFGNRTLESVTINIMKTRVEAKIKEGVFIEEDNFVFYVNSFSPKDRTMRDVFIVDKRKGKESTVLAKKARFIPGKNKIFIRLMDYKVFGESAGGESRIIESQFSSDYPIEIGSILETSENDELEPREMYLEELVEFIDHSQEDIKKINIAKLKMLEMFSLPMAVLIIGIAGVPLGAQIRAKGRTKGIIISLLLFLSYYIILASVRTMCENGTINPTIGVWLPVLFLLIVSVLLLVRSAGNLSLGFLNRLTLFNTSQ